MDEDELVKSLKQYTFDDPTPDPAMPHQLRITARHQGKPVGSLTFNAKPHSDEMHPHRGFHMINTAEVHPLHRGNGVFGRMLHIAAGHVKRQFKSQGLVSPGEWNSEAAAGAFQKLAEKGKGRVRPGNEPGSPDFFMSEKDDESDPLYIQHEFEVEFKRWMACRVEGTPGRTYDLDKAEATLEDLLGRHGNLPNGPSEDHLEVARHMVGYDPQTSPEFIAARFLAGGGFASDDAVRTALILYDTDFEMAALRAYGLPRNEAYREMLRATMALRSYLPEVKKSEIEPAAIPRDIQAALPEGEKCAAAVRRAQSSGHLVSVQLDPSAKHSKGTAIATDPDSKEKKLLKPGSGKLSPSAGVRDETADQSQREVAWAKLVRALGVQDFYPHADLLIVDGQRVAALDLLATDYKGLDKVRQADASFDPSKLFQPYVASGELYKWALIDWIFGNPDRHANNIMINTDHTDLKLIDHGSAFAGINFDPAHDSKSFVPFYLRAWAQDKVWSELSPQEREDEIPRMNADDSVAFGQWIEGIDEAEVTEIMQKYGLNPGPVIARLRQLKSIDPAERADYLIGLWVGALS